MDNSGFANDSGVLGGSNQVKSTHIYIYAFVSNLRTIEDP